jgi:ribosome biogenesis SPOUT family RNA methylase Rps3
MTKKPRIVIEHLEPELSEWLWYEYANASKIAGREFIWFTNVRDDQTFKSLNKLGTVKRENILELLPHEDLVILDPQAAEPLTPRDCDREAVLVVGGILGDRPPKGRTKSLLTKRAPRARARQIGDHQFAIDGSVYVALEVARGKFLQEIPIKRGLVLKKKLGRRGWHEIELPYAYPLVKESPLISKELINYLLREESK